MAAEAGAQTVKGSMITSAVASINAWEHLKAVHTAADAHTFFGVSGGTLAAGASAVAVAVLVIAVIARLVRALRYRPPLPAPLKASDMMAGDKATLDKFVANMRDYYFNIVEVTPDQYEVLEALRNNAVEYLDQPEAVKLEQKPKPKEGDLEILKKRSKNQGYVPVPGVKEYIKMRITEPDIPFPAHPVDFLHNHERAFQIFEGITGAGLKAMSEYKVRGKTLMMEGTYENISQFIHMKSSISTISYHPRSAEDMVRDNGQPFYHSPEHFDTGLLTCIVASDVPGLQVWDNQAEEYVYVEEHVVPTFHLFVIQGRKIDLFCNGAKVFPPTKHRVLLPAETARVSMLYFQDVP